MTTNQGNNNTALLAKILEATQEANDVYDWDPATFSVTVAIGIIALGFALLPILYSLLFPPENLKYDKAAIGAWSQLKTKRWNPGNMRFAVTTRTPFLDISEIADWRSEDVRFSKGKGRLLPFWKRFPSSARRALFPHQKATDISLPLQEISQRGQKSDIIFSTPTGSPVSRIKDDSSSETSAPNSTSAGWLSLLQTLRLEEIAFKCASTRPAPATLCVR